MSFQNETSYSVQNNASLPEIYILAHYLCCVPIYIHVTLESTPCLFSNVHCELICQLIYKTLLCCTILS